jgi:hypothetical protein
MISSESAASFEAPPAVWNQLFSSSSSSHAVSKDDEVRCTQWAIRHLAASLNTTTELAAWALLAHSGIFARAKLHLKLLLAAAAAATLHNLPREDVHQLFLIDSLSWNPSDDEQALNESQDDLRTRRGSDEVDLRIRFLTSDDNQM